MNYISSSKDCSRSIGSNDGRLLSEEAGTVVALENDFSTARDDDSGDVLPILLEKGILPSVIAPIGTDQDRRLGDDVKPLKVGTLTPRNKDKTTDVCIDISEDCTEAKMECTQVQPIEGGEEEDIPRDRDEALPEGLRPCPLRPGVAPAAAQEIITPTSQPGAFAAYPGGRAPRVESYSLVEAESGSHGPEPTATDSDDPAVFGSSRYLQDNSRLTEATPVSGENPAASLPGAVPVDPERREQERTFKDRQQLFGFFLLFLIALAVIVVAIVAVVVPDKESQMEAPVANQDDAAKTSQETSNPSLTPTLAPTDSSDSSGLIDLLPPSSLDAIMTPLSPQSKAYGWVMEYVNETEIADWRQIQLFALATIFYSLNGEDWEDAIQEDWLADWKSECDWFSSLFAKLYWGYQQRKYVIEGANTNETSCDETGKFTKLHLVEVMKRGSNQYSTLPPEVALLSDLESIRLQDFRFSNISDIVLPELSQLTGLHTLKFGDETLTGSIPQELFETLSALDNLKHFVVTDSKMTGTIPSDFHRLSNLRKLSIISYAKDTAAFHGSIPKELYSLSHMEEFTLTARNVAGRLLPDITNWRNLTRLSIWASLEGGIPTDLGELTELSYLDCQSFAFSSGTIPSEFGLLSKLTHLGLSYDDLLGTIPSEIAMLQHLESLQACSNSFTGTIPEGIWLLPRMTQICFSDNRQLQGSIPTEVGLMTQLGALELSNCDFNGSIPLGSLASDPEAFVTLNLNGNAFSGTGLPTDVGVLTDLRTLDLSNNAYLSGTIPSEIGNCEDLACLYVQGNSFSGTIPTEIGLIPYLREMDLSNNTDLIGPIPSELGMIAWLNRLLLHGTSLTGSIPEGVCSLKNQGRISELVIDCAQVSCNCSCTCG